MFRKKFLGMVLAAVLLISQSVPRALAATYCDQAQFVSDLTIPDGSSFAPGAAFTKGWRLMNVGTCTWSTSYTLVSAGGDSVGAPAPVKLPATVAPGQMVDIYVNLTAPTAAGHYKALFKLSNSSGVQFGIGDSASDPFWVDINVIENNAVIYDFTANALYAQWKSGAGIIPYPGTSGDSRGFGYQVDKPHLEDDSFDSAPGLLVVPQNKFNGYIQATYPEFQVQQGDRLQTLVNCEFGATNCYVTFRIDYLLPNGVQRTLWSWKEANDKRFYRASIDLSPLAGQKVRFVLMLLASGFASGDRAIWGAPRITRSGPTQPPGPPPTLTPLPPLPPTATPIGQPPPTVVPSGCDKAAFVTDATVPDGTIFSPGAAFTKTWRLRNVGSCAWTTAYKLVYYSGDPMSAPTTVNLPWNVAFNQTVDISVNMVAPTTVGKYRGFWILSNTSGQFFGIGSDASKPIWVEINVAGEAPVNTGYDFTANVCSAEWRSTVGVLPCPGTDGNANGFVIKLDTPKQEDGTTGGPGLLTVPQNRYNGYIQGFYPTFTVLPGDKFQTTVGCEYGAACYLTYRLDYMTASGYIQTFWTWREQNEGKVSNASIDLTLLAGRSVRFILTILSTGSATNDRALWGSPRIVRTGGTPTPTPTVTLTPPPPSDWLKYTNPVYGFEFRYPSQAQIVEQSNNSLRMNLPFMPGTNLVEKYLQMSVNENVNPCQSPLSSTSRPGSPTETVVINGISFFKQIGGDAGMNQLHEWVGYSTLKGNACISMDFVLHSIATGAYATPPPEFDKAGESAVFAQIMGTFGWTPATVTPIPPTVPPVLVQSPEIRKLFMIDTSNGWAISNSYILHTYDGGASWYSLTPSGISPIRNAFFSSPNHGWVLTTDSLYRTVDGGATWSQYNVPFNGGYVQFLDDSNGFVLSGEPSGMHKHAVSLYQTADGGATWTLKYANDPSQPNNTLPFGGVKNGMTFRDTGTGWIGGYIPSPGTVYLYKTSNGGTTWAQQSVALPAGYASADVNVTSPTFFGSNDGILPVWTSSSAGGTLLMYVTHDGGASWTLSGNVPSQGRKAYDFVSMNDGFAWNGALQVTHNTGASWNSVTPNVTFGDNVPAMDFISPTIGWILQNSYNGSTPLYRTTDGGATWALVSGTAPPTEPQGPLPDLTIVQMHIELQNTGCLMPGDTMGVRLWIKNNGQAAAGSFVVNVNNLEQTVNGLGVGETKDVFFAGYGNPVNAVVDPMNLITESDETNNSRSEMVPVPTPPLPCVTPAELAQTVVEALNAKNFDVTKTKMGSSFMLAFWRSQGLTLTPEEAIQQLQTNYIGATTVLTHDPDRDLNALLGVDPYTIMGLDPSNSLAFFVSGWGLDGKGEAILYMTKRTDGNPYWHSVLIAPTGFTTGSATHEAFCADARIPVLIEQLKASMNQSNGDMFASLVSPTHGVDVRFWAYAAPVNFSIEKARNVFNSAESYNWGGGPRGVPDVGSFKDLIQPKLQEVFNAPNMETYCDDLTRVFPLSIPWPYPNIRYYNLYKPATGTPGNEFDFRTWLIGFEYINDQPYLYAMVTIVWEP